MVVGGGPQDFFSIPFRTFRVQTGLDNFNECEFLSKDQFYIVSNLSLRDEFC